MDLKKLQQKFTKKFGEHVVSSAADDAALARIRYGVSTQCLSLDLILGRPGFPAGRLTEVVGITNQGKSTLGYHVLAECQRLGGEAILLETENAFERERLEEIGVDSKKLTLLQPKTLEEILEMTSMAMAHVRLDQKFQGPVVILVDSIAGTPTAAEYEGDFSERHMGAAARVMSIGLRKLIGPLAEHRVVLVFLNQLYSSMQQYGEPYVSYGGSQIHKSASIRLRLSNRKADLIKRGEHPIGTLTTALTIKNKLATQFQATKYLLNFEHGIDPLEDLWRSALRLQVLKASKNAFQFALNGKSATVERSKFEDFVVSKFKTPQALRERLVTVAVEKKLMKVYGG